MKILIKILIVFLMADFIKVPSYSLTPERITLFERLQWNGFSDSQKEAFKNLKKNKSKYNDISKAGRKRLRNSVAYLLYMSKQKDIIGFKKNFKNISDNEILIEKKEHTKKKSQKYKLTFTTLTLSSPQIHTDNVITSKLLNSFLNSLRRKWNVEKYIWKAEKQENGNIHYHILTDQFIYWKEIREVWNRIQNSLGYVDRYSENMKEFFKDDFRMSNNPKDKRSKETQYKAYLVGLKNGFTDPNSTDIHSLYKIKNIPAYVSKYISKPITKTDRTNKIDFIISEIKVLKRSIKDLRVKMESVPYQSREWYSLANLESDCYMLKKENKLKLKELKEKGVTGRIWGQSQSLSKIKPFTDEENFKDIPDIDIVDKIARFKHIVEVGSENVITSYFFDIEKTPGLKEVLNRHISKCLNGPDLIEKLNFQNALTSFYEPAPAAGEEPLINLNNISQPINLNFELDA